MRNPHRRSGLNSLSTSSPSAKRTLLDTGSSGSEGGGSVNSSGLPATDAAAVRSANLVSLVTPTQAPFPPTTRLAPRTSFTAASSAPLSVTQRLQSTTSGSNTCHDSNNTQNYTHGITLKYLLVLVLGTAAIMPDLASLDDALYCSSPRVTISGSRSG
ncbi:hypothetical protein SprV_0200793600 [Sparganum proliferum]